MLDCRITKLFWHKYSGLCFLYFITARVAKRAKVMFSQACVTHSVQQGGGGVQHQRSTTFSPGTRSQHLPAPWDQVTTPPSPWTTPAPLPGTRSQHPPPSLPPWTTPPPPDYAQAGGTHPTGMHYCLNIQ